MSIRRCLDPVLDAVMKRRAITDYGAFSVSAGSIALTSLSRRYDECTAICVAIPYTDAQKRHPAPQPPTQSLLAYVEAFAWNTDYHRDVKSLLTELAVALREEDARYDVACDIWVDNSGLDDREIALRAGVGRLGKNNLLLSDRYGSRFFIGYLIYPQLLSVPMGEELPPWSFETPPPAELRHPRCDRCGICVARCPSQALGRDMTRCISYLTQSKDEIAVEMMPYLENQLYGCSICQRVCPLNEATAWSADSYVDPRELLTLSNRAFKERYGAMGFAWRPLWVYQRNALIVIANCGDAADLRWLEEQDFSARPQLAAVYETTLARLRNRIGKTP